MYLPKYFKRTPHLLYILGSVLQIESVVLLEHFFILNKKSLMLKFYFLTLLFIFGFCWKIDIEIEINEDYLLTRQFNNLLNLKNSGKQILDCSLIIKVGNEKSVTKGLLEENNKIKFLDVSEEFLLVGIYSKNKNNYVEFLFELPENYFVSKFNLKENFAGNQVWEFNGKFCFI